MQYVLGGIMLVIYPLSGDPGAGGSQEQGAGAGAGMRGIVQIFIQGLAVIH